MIWPAHNMVANASVAARSSHPTGKWHLRAVWGITASKSATDWMNTFDSADAAHLSVVVPFFLSVGIRKATLYLESTSDLRKSPFSVVVQVSLLVGVKPLISRQTRTTVSGGEKTDSRACKDEPCRHDCQIPLIPPLCFGRLLRKQSLQAPTHKSPMARCPLSTLSTVCR